MATRGGLEIHMEMVHAVAPAAAVVPVGAPVPALPQGTVAPRAVALPRAPSAEWQLPRFLRGIDPTLPVTALLVVALFFAGLVAAVHRSAGGTTATAGAGAHGASSPEASATAPATAVDPAADQRLAQSLVLTPTDYPDGWTFAPHQTSPSDAQNNRLDATCLGLPDPAATQSADVSGPDANQTDLTQAASEVVVFRTQQQAAANLAAEGGLQAEACAEQALTRAFAAGGITVTDVRVGRFALSTGNVPSVALHAEVAAVKGASGGVIHTDVVFLQQGRVEGQAVFLSFAGQFPPDTEQTLVTRFAHKLANA